MKNIPIFNFYIVTYKLLPGKTTVNFNSKDSIETGCSNWIEIHVGRLRFSQTNLRSQYKLRTMVMTVLGKGKQIWKENPTKNIQHALLL